MTTVPDPKFQVDDPVIVDWSSGAKFGWVTEVLDPPNTCKKHWYRVLQRDGSEVRIAERLLLPRKVE